MAGGITRSGRSHKSDISLTSLKDSKTGNAEEIKTTPASADRGKTLGKGTTIRILGPIMARAGAQKKMGFIERLRMNSGCKATTRLLPGRTNTGLMAL